MADQKTTNKCSVCGKPILRSGYCNECLRKHRRSHNYLTQLFWVLDKLGGKCACCGERIEFACDFVIHRKERHRNWLGINANNKKLHNIKKWMEEDKIPEDVTIVCEKCSKRIQVMDNLEVLRYYPHTVVNSQLSYDPYKRAKNQLRGNWLLRKLERKRMSLMTNIGKERYEKNYRL